MALRSTQYDKLRLSQDTIPLRLREFEDCRNAVTCPICLNALTDGRRLSCSHTFCFNCLTDYITSKILDNKQCPTCREVTVPLANQLCYLPVNAFANEVANLVRIYQKMEEGQIGRLKWQPFEAGFVEMVCGVWLESQ